MATSLSSVANSQLSGLTGRKIKMPYNLSMIAQLPAARDLEQTRLTNQYRTEALAQDKDQFEKTLAQNKTQFDADQALKTDQANTANDQSKKASAISGLSTAVQLGYLTKDATGPMLSKTIDGIKTGATSLKDAASGYLGSAGTNTAVNTAANAATNSLGSSAALDGSALVDGYQLGTSSGSTIVGNGLASATPQIATDAALAADMAPAATDASMAALDTYAMGGNTAALGGELATSAGTAAPTVAAESTSALGGASGVLAIIAAAELAKNKWGGNGISWDEKTKQQKVVDSPVTAGMLATLMPGIGTAALVAPEGTLLGDMYKNLAGAERLAMKPIDWLFGNK